MTVARMTAAEYQKQVRDEKPKRSKYGAQKVKTEEGTFDSTLEHTRWHLLKLKQRSGLIRDLQRQVKIPLIGKDGPLLTERGNPMHYVADATYQIVECGTDVVEDTKGMSTPEYLLKKAILRSQGINITEVRR